MKVIKLWLAPFTDVENTLEYLACDLHVRVRGRHKQMFWKSYEIWQCSQTSERRLSSLQGKILSQPSLRCFLHVPCRLMSLKFLGKLEKEWLETCWKMEKQIIQWLFFHRVASLHRKPINFKIALIASHKLPHLSQSFQRSSLERTEWIMWKMVCVCFIGGISGIWLFKVPRCSQLCFCWVCACQGCNNMWSQKDGRIIAYKWRERRIW